MAHSFGHGLYHHSYPNSKYDLPPFPNDYHYGSEISPHFAPVNAFTNVPPMINPGGFGTPSLSDVPMINPREFGTPSLSDMPMINPGEFGTPSVSDVPMINPGEFGTPSLSNDNRTGSYCSSYFTSELNPIINQKIGNVAKPDNWVPNGAHHPLPDANHVPNNAMLMPDDDNADEDILNKLDAMNLSHTRLLTDGVLSANGREYALHPSDFSDHKNVHKQKTQKRGMI
ncbi:hypothetical protein niasHT_020717 [Heterodera trifolii]|uniref:Uncharacterized protein n=1 Tax=Heterodera trifolii TaxID=157864 RepID=A0ABD2KM48_9BILA